MGLSTLFTIAAVYFGVFGLAALLAPGTLLPLFYSAEPGEVAAWEMRFAGVAWLGLAALTWFARHQEDSAARRGIVLALVAFYGLSAIVALMGALSDAGPAALWWPNVGVYLLFALVFGYLGLVKSGTS
jgi:hypothetical protein